MEAVKNNLTSHHNFHHTEDPDRLVHHGDPSEGAKSARESLVGHGYEHIDSVTNRDFTSPRHHVYRSKEHGGWAVVTEPKIKDHKTTVKFKQVYHKGPPKVLGSVHHRNQFPFHNQHHGSHKVSPHKQEFLDHPDVKQFGGKEHTTSNPHHMTHLKNGDFSLHHTHSEGRHHVTFHHQLPNGHIHQGHGSHHSLGVAMLHATKDLASKHGKK